MINKGAASQDTFFTWKIVPVKNIVVGFMKFNVNKRSQEQTVDLTEFQRIKLAK